MIGRAGGMLPRLSSARTRWAVLQVELTGSFLVYAIGPGRWASSGSFDVLELLMPMRWWGWVYGLVALLLLVHRPAGHVAGFLLHGAFLLGTAAAVVTGASEGAAAPLVFLVVAMAHFQGLVVSHLEGEPG